MHGEFFGISSGAAVPVYARAAVLNEEGARPTLSSELLIDAYRRFKRGDDETDLILVATDAALALLVAIPPGLVLAGVVAQEEMPAPAGIAPTIPIISGFVDAKQQISDGDLVILDPDLGRVLVEPDAEEFARLQADRNRRPRVHIDAFHVAARTQSGRTVAVWASVRTDEDLKVAVKSGADGLVIEKDSDFLSSVQSEFGEADSDELESVLLALADQIGGGDMAIVADPTEVDPAVMFSVAARCTLRWAVGADALLISTVELRSEIEQMLSDCLTDDTTTRKQTPVMPGISGVVETIDGLHGDLSGFNELFLTVDIAATLTIADTFELPSLLIIMDADLTGLPIAFAIGAAGVVVLPGQVGGTKDFIRAQAY